MVYKITTGLKTTSTDQNPLTYENSKLTNIRIPDPNNTDILLAFKPDLYLYKCPTQLNKYNIGLKSTDDKDNTIYFICASDDSDRPSVSITTMKSKADAFYTVTFSQIFQFVKKFHLNLQENNNSSFGFDAYFHSSFNILINNDNEQFLNFMSQNEKEFNQILFLSDYNDQQTKPVGDMNGTQYSLCFNNSFDNTNKNINIEYVDNSILFQPMRTNQCDFFTIDKNLSANLLGTQPVKLENLLSNDNHSIPKWRLNYNYLYLSSTNPSPFK
tara:strand:- start:1044 stop:1856 length:813 start_codon:yes stop_codon:yes gene_type:complete